MIKLYINKSLFIGLQGEWRKELTKFQAKQFSA